MLRRTWTITKGSLGRIRRRTSGEDPVFETSNDHVVANSDHRKYFSFKKHFRKGLTGLSTFYLENNQENRNSKESNETNSINKEEIYSNSNWYTQVGLWRDDSSSLQSEANSAGTFKNNLS